ncbi:MAG: PDZ domain-containing protein [Bacteroidota bacterium]
MKNLFTTILLLTFILSSGQAQNSDKWETWAENIAESAERLAENVSRDMERNAAEIAIAAENLALDIEERFDNGDFNVQFNWRDKLELGSDHHTAYLGIHSDHISKKKAERLGFKNMYGSYVTKVVRNSAADKAGLQPFDYIYGAEDQRTSNNQDLSDILADYEPGDKIDLHYIRDGQKKTTKVELGEYDDFDWDDYADERAFLGVKPSASERRDDMDGVTVDIVNNSAAEEMGLEDGDIIKSINGYPVLDWDDVSTAIDNLEPDEKITVKVERGGQRIEKTGNVHTKSNENYSVNYQNNNNGNNWNWDWDNDNDDEVWEGGGAFLGIYLEDISEDKARALGFDNPYGSYISGIIEGTAAEKAGLMPFDYIFGIDEYRVGVEQSLGGILRKFEAGDEADVHFYRKGKKTSKSVIFRVRPETKNKYKGKNKCDDPFLGIIEMDRSRYQEGVRVNPVDNSTAEKLGLERGDIITHINGYQMYDWTDIGIAIDMMTPGETIEIDYTRDGEKMSGSREIMSYAKTKNCDDCDCGGKNDIVIISPKFDFRIPGINSNQEIIDEEPRADISDLDVRMENISNEDSRSMQARGIDMKISNQLEVDNLTLQPNADIGMFDLQFDIESRGETIVKVINTTGRVIYEYDLGPFSGDFADHIDISQNGPGTYFLHISQDDKSFVRKIALTKN